MQLYPIKVKTLFLVCTLFIAVKTYANTPSINIEEVIRSTDTIKTTYIDTPTLPLFQGNGNFASCYGPLGLHINPEAGSSYYKYGKTQFMHYDHWVRGKFGADYLIPLGYMYWTNTPQHIENYKQKQSYYDGTISTEFSTNNSTINMLTWFDTIDEDIAGYIIDVKGDAFSDITLKPAEKLAVHYGQNLTQVTTITKTGNNWKVDMSCLNCKTSMYIKTNADVQVQGNTLSIKLHPGTNEILISINHPTAINATTSLEQTRQWWHETWENTGLLVLPDKDAQNMWVHSIAQFLMTFNKNMHGFPAPCGLSGNMWPFSFPQDISYIHPVLLSTGKIDIAKAWSEKFASDLVGMKQYTKRLLKVDGILCPWTYPYGDFDGYHTPSVPNRFYYEIHNSGYLARMVYETAVFVNDEEWTKRVAAPIIEETARFYKNISTKRDDGLWHLSVRPSTGQDEHGGSDQDDYLCSLFSATYCFQKAIEYSLDDDGMYATILKDGLAFDSLKSPNGFYYSCAGQGLSDFGHQKHPVQLNDLAYLPIHSSIQQPSLTAYNLRYKITKDANKPYFYGWTLGEFLLAGSRVGDTYEWVKDWDNMLTSDYIDGDWTQVYETSKAFNASYYTTTNGLIAQSLINNLVSDWFGTLEIAKCNPWKEPIYLKNIYSKLGVKIDGVINGKSAQLTLTGWKDCTFTLDGETMNIKKGEIIHKTISPSTH